MNKDINVSVIYFLYKKRYKKLLILILYRQLSEAVGCNFSPDIVHELIKSASNHQKDDLNKKNSPKKELEEGITKLILECISYSLMYCNPSKFFSYLN